MMRELEAAQWLPEAVLLERQRARLAAILDHAAERSPFYADAWGKGRSGAANLVARFRDLPQITKKDLQQNQPAMLASGSHGAVSTKTTGGSTGEAVTLVKDRRATAAERAATWLAYGWFGVRMGDLGVRFWGSPVTARRRLMYTAADLAMNRMRFSAFAFTDRDLDEYWQRCIDARPDYFYGYVSMIESLAQHVVRRNAQHRWPELKVVITTAEVLTDPQRQLFKAAFGVPVQNEYGCGEVGPIAYECKAGSLHLITENQVVEILKPDGSEAGIGETGDIVITDLHNRAMPLIRYRVGDLGVRGEPCTCGRGFPVLQKVWGREYDLVETPDGRRYHGEFFMYLFEDLRSSGAGVDKFQVIQTGPASLEVRIVCAGGDSGMVRERVRREIMTRLPAMSTEVVAVDRIEAKRSGKTSVVENRWAKRATASQVSGEI